MIATNNPLNVTVDKDKTVKGGFVKNDPVQESLLKELGPEGNLQEENNVYNILNNTSIGYWSVSIRVSRLPSQFQTANGWQLRIDDAVFAFTKNLFEKDIYEVDVEDTVASSIEAVRNAIFEVK